MKQKSQKNQQSQSIQAEPHAGLNCINADLSAPTLLGVRFIGHVDGPLVDLTVEQTYLNSGDSDLEVVYTFPLPPRAVLSGLDFELNGRRFAGTVKAKAQAAADYEHSVAEGDTPVLVELAANGLYTANLGNLRAQDRALIRFRYTQLATAADQDWRIAIPTVLAPLYGDAIRDGGLAPHQVPSNSLAAEYPLQFELLIASAEPTAAVRCTSHAVSLNRSAEGLRVQSGADARLDRDIVLFVPRAAQAWAVCTPDLQGQLAFATVVAPITIEPADGAHAPVSLRVVLDCSGSMAGTSMDWATVACQRLIGGLQDRDEFSITRFGSSQEHMRPRMQPASVQARQQALEWLSTVQANLGGTEMQGALQSASALPGTQAASDIVLITDGDIWAADSLIRWARASARRVFVVGVGASPNAAFLRELGEATGGSSEMVTPGEDLVHAVDRIAARLRAPSPSLEVSWPFTPQWTLQWPTRPAPGDVVLLAAGGAAEAGAELQVMLDTGLQRVRLAARTDSDGSICKFAAHERIRCGQFDDPAFAAEQYQLVTEWTSLIAVAVRAADDKADGLPRLAPVQQMVPAGWGGLGLPQELSAAAAVAAAPLSAPLAVPLSALPAQGMVPSLVLKRSVGPASAEYARGRAMSKHTKHELHETANAARAARMELALQDCAAPVRTLLDQTRRNAFAQQMGVSAPALTLAALKRAGLPAALLARIAPALDAAADAQAWLDALLAAFRVLIADPVLDSEQRLAVWDRWADAGADDGQEPPLALRREVKQVLDAFVAAAGAGESKQVS